jgi:hypothetical protein
MVARLDKFSVIALIVEIILIVVWGAWFEYGEHAKPGAGVPGTCVRRIGSKRRKRP